jgi:hypothetical protein
MRQFMHTARCLGIALVLVAAVGALATAQPAAARPKSEVESACYASGGEYYEMWLSDPADPTNEQAGVLTYGCFLPDGRDLECYDFTPDPAVCILTPAPAPEDNVGEVPPDSSHPADGELVDQSSAGQPAPTNPTDGHQGDPYAPGLSASSSTPRSGFETTMTGR